MDIEARLGDQEDVMEDRRTQLKHLCLVDAAGLETLHENEADLTRHPLVHAEDVGAHVEEKPVRAAAVQVNLDQRKQGVTDKRQVNRGAQGHAL